MTTCVAEVCKCHQPVSCKGHEAVYHFEFMQRCEEWTEGYGRVYAMVKLCDELLTVKRT
jgi:hypothetical protein